MQRSAALVLSILFFILFSIIAYYGTKITLCSSIIVALLISLIILNIFYPPSQVPMDEADYTLVVYACIEIVGLLLLGVYIAYKTLTDVQTSC